MVLSIRGIGRGKKEPPAKVAGGLLKKDLARAKTLSASA
jgi:hypothetical protein